MKTLQGTINSIVNIRLKRIYKANQCTDFNDCDIAIKELYEIKNTYGYTKSLIRRMASLRKRMTTLNECTRFNLQNS